MTRPPYHVVVGGRMPSLGPRTAGGGENDGDVGLVRACSFGRLPAVKREPLAPSSSDITQLSGVYV